LAVQIGLVLLVAIVGTSLGRGALRVEWNAPLTYIKYDIELIMLVIPLWFIFRGRNWARWLLVAYAIGGLCVSLPRVIRHVDAAATSWLLTYALLNLAAVAALIALFLPSSSQWFRRATNEETA
jgi:hypothetical protein